MNRPKEITFARLGDVPLDAIAAHMSDPRVVAHMPLAEGRWDVQRCADFVEMKEGFWQRDGLGHWAFLADGDYVGWGGFQKEGDDWDMGLVLAPGHFGLGPRIAAQAIDFARADPRIPYVTFLLPFSRRHLGALDRIGAREDGEVELGGARFRKFYLPTG